MSNTPSCSQGNEFPFQSDFDEVIVLSPQGTQVAALQGNAIVVRTPEGALIRTVLNGFGTRFSCVNFSGDGRLLLAGGSTGEVFVWDMEHKDSMPLANRAPYSYAPILKIVSSPQGTKLAVLTERSEVQVWCLAHRDVMHRYSVTPFATELCWVDERTLTTNTGEWADGDPCPSVCCLSNEEKDEQEEQVGIDLGNTA